jgi:hypothetical protein
LTPIAWKPPYYPYLRHEVSTKRYVLMICVPGSSRVSGPTGPYLALLANQNVFQPRIALWSLRLSSVCLGPGTSIAIRVADLMNCAGALGDVACFVLERLPNDSRRVDFSVVALAGVAKLDLPVSPRSASEWQHRAGSFPKLLRSDRPRLFRISRLRCGETESKTVPYVSAREAATQGRMVGKTGSSTRLHSLALAFPPPRCQE